MVTHVLVKCVKTGRFIKAKKCAKLIKSTMTSKEIPLQCEKKPIVLLDIPS